jgi:hypothetical protein
MDTSNGTSDGRPKNARARFNPVRRREVQEVRRIGACSRCRILRKTCDNKSPCTACERVINPRVWNAGCIRDKLSDHVHLYSASVQIVLSQARYKSLKEEVSPVNVGTTIELFHFPSAATISASVLERPPGVEQISADERIVMIDAETEDLPQKVEAYVQQILPILIQVEPSHFMRVTLETAVHQATQADDKLLRLAIDLWGLVEIIDREQQWKIYEKAKSEDASNLKELAKYQVTPRLDIRTVLFGQISAAAERKANTISKAVLEKMNRDLHDSKTKLGFRMFVAAIILLNCIEKTTWAFQTWDNPSIRQAWPLDKEPKSFTEDVGKVADNLRTLLAMRKVLPVTARGENGEIVTEDQNPEVQEYFAALNLDCELYLNFPTLPLYPNCTSGDAVKAKQEKLQFDQSDTRSLELYYCSHLLQTDSPSADEPEK